MGNFEKLVVLLVLFLSAVVLAVSLRDGEAEVDAASPLDAAQARLEEPVYTTPAAAGPETALGDTDPQAEELEPSLPAETGEVEAAPADFLLDASIEEDAAGQEELEPGPQRILRTTRGLKPSALEDYMVYTIAEGDTWSALAQRFYRDARHVRALRLANEDLETLAPGTPILVPVYDLSQEAGTRSAFVPGAPSEGIPESAAAPVAEPDQDWSQATVYQVRAGDSLSVISQRVYGTAARWNLIFQANKGVLETPDWLQVGMRLRIPRGAELEALQTVDPDRPRVR